MTAALGPKSGRKQISATNDPQRLNPTSFVTGAVAVKRDPDDGIVGTVYIGDSSVNANGWPLTEPVAMNVTDLREVYVYGPQNAIVFWLVTKKAQ